MRCPYCPTKMSSLLLGRADGTVVRVWFCLECRSTFGPEPEPAT